MTAGHTLCLPTWVTRRRILLLVTALASAAAALIVLPAAPASAGFRTFSHATIAAPLGMDEAPDGSLWFANYGNDSIGRIDPVTEVVTNFVDVGIDGPRSVSVAPNGVVWFTSSDNGRLGRIDGGVVSTFPAMTEVDDVEVAADGDIWVNAFTSTGQDIARFDPSTGTLAQGYTVPGFVGRMTPHPTDGMWFTSINNSFTDARIRHVTEAGALTGFTTGAVNDPTDLTMGPDGRLWFTSEDNGLVSRMNPTTGAMTSFDHPQVVAPGEIVEGPGGDLWFTNQAGGRFGRVDPVTGAIVLYRDPTDTVQGPTGLALGGDGNLWYTRADGFVGTLELGTCDGRAVTVDLALGSRPTGAADVIRGTAGANTINAGGGNDVVCALDGNDEVNGGTGGDRLFLGAGADRADGGAGADLCDGGRGRDTAVGCESRIAIP